MSVVGISNILCSALGMACLCGASVIGMLIGWTSVHVAAGLIALSAIGVIVVASLPICCNQKSEGFVKGTMPLIIGGLVAFQVILLIVCYATIGGEVDAMCGEIYTCYSSSCAPCTETNPMGLGDVCEHGTVYSCSPANSTNLNCGTKYMFSWDDGPDGGDDGTWMGFDTEEDCSDNFVWDPTRGNSLRESAYSLVNWVLVCFLCTCIPAVCLAVVAKTTPFLELAPMAPMAYNTSATTVQPGAAQNPNLPAGWAAMVDPATGRTYYFNATTQETSWTMPGAAPAVVAGTVVSTPAGDAAPAYSAAPLPEGWSEATDPSTGNTYYHHTDGQTAWERPTPGDVPTKA